MKTQSMLLAALTSAPAAFAHTAFTDFFVNGVPQGDGVAMRMSTNTDGPTNPISSLNSDDMACNVGGSKGVSRVQSVSDGATLSFEIRAWPADPTNERLDPRHKGPCAVYLKKVGSAIEDTAAGDGWFKIMEHGYNSDTDRWCTDEIIGNNGLLNAKLPAGLEGGNYLARPEILALHAVAADNDPQFYTGCAQIFLESNGNLVPESTVSIPGYVDYNQPATSFNIYNTDASTYQLPGPKLAKLTANSAQIASTGQMTQTEGLEPAGCLVENGNWCGVEVADYSDEKGCWASSADCWVQSKKCYDTAPITGNAGCELYSAKCENINTQCNSGNFQGPPNKNKVLGPVKKSIDIGAILSGQLDSSSADTTPQEAPAKPSAAPSKATNAAPADEPASYSTAAAPKPAPSSIDDYSSPDINDSEAEEEAASSSAPTPSEAEAPEATSTKAAPTYDAAPAPTPAPEVPDSSEGGSSCKEGYVCVTVTDLKIVTKYVTVTAESNAYRKRGSGHVHRRHARR